MYTKNKRKYQNKPAQRTVLRSPAPAPKFKNKKEKFMKETLPCIVLLIFMAFWSIGSALSIIDKIKQRQPNSSMITASAEEFTSFAFEVPDIFSYDLPGLNSFWFYDDMAYISYSKWDITFDMRNAQVFLTDGTSNINVSSETQFFYSDFYGTTDITLYPYYLGVYSVGSLNLLPYGCYPFSLTYSLVNFEVSRSTLSLNFILTDGTSNYTYTIYLFCDEGFSLNFPYTYTVNLVNFNNTDFFDTQRDLEETQNDLSQEIEYRRELENSLQQQFEQGYDAGFNIGFGLGRNEGIESSNNYSFLSLISAVVDVPVRTFTSLFDWNLLGINLKQFFLSILSVMAILAAVKLIMR